MSASSDAGLLAIEESGRGKPLVLIHGLGTDRGVWADAARSLERHHRVVVLDLPGFGDSDPVGEGFDLDHVALSVGDALESRLGGGYDLLGHSLGGAVALSLARLRPEAISGLILSAPAGFRPRARPLATSIATAAPVLLRGRRLIGDRLVESDLARRVLLWGALSDAATISPERARAMLDASSGASRLREAAETAMTADLSAELAAIEVDVGFLWGTRDPLMPEATTDVIRQCRPKAPVELVPGAGHVAQVERPEAFAMAVESLLAKLHGPVTTS